VRGKGPRLHGDGAVSVPLGATRRRRLRRQNEAAAAHLARELGLPAPAARVLAARGFDEPDAARLHLSPRPDALHDPFGMAGLPEAVEHLARTARRGGRVVVFGDYDCDGIGALAILTTVLTKLGADARPFIPHRLHDGYGLRAPTLLRALEEHAPEGIVTVDCGITAVDPVATATSRGVYMVVTDHHLPPAALPEGAVLVDPKLPGCRYPFKELCGAGIAWKMADALLIHSGERVGIDPAARRRWLGSLAKIAALSTVADMVPLTGENRVLTSWGLAGLARPRSPGLAALLRRAGIPAGRAPTAREVAFRIAPRLNAAGRIDHAARALELLVTGDAARAEILADEIESANEERRAVQERVVETVLERLATSFDPDRDAVVVEAGESSEGWHRGVLGIAASRVAQHLGRPVLLLAREGPVVSGSGRTFGTTPLFERLAPVAARYTREFGGHAAALGLTLPTASYEAFREDLQRAFAQQRDEGEWVEDLLLDTEASGGDLDEELATVLKRFEPHGQGNPKPLLSLRGLEWDGRGKPVGERGLRTSFASGGRHLDAVGWTLQALSPSTRSAGRFDVAANLSIDSFTGRPSLTIVDLVPAAS
jgi:single-stranded-DNA-specific exonuclease